MTEKQIRKALEFATREQLAELGATRLSQALGTIGGKNSGGARPGAGRPRVKDRCHCEKNSIKTAVAQSFNCCKKAGVYPKHTN